uniref:Gem-associated protein 5-like n=1 Tax=Dermatophagoides pteronyssinus TaxID=6956 RepID=A0A6P6XPB1_DERPT|nr:gem-associated protein 5-like [Dermatophagoides pteronyssinus]
MAEIEKNDLIPIQNEIIKEQQQEEDGDIVDEQEEIEESNSKVEFSFGTFWNWFLPSCLDVWSSPSSTSSSSNPEMFIAYGAKSFLFLADIIVQKSKTKKNSTTNNEMKKWKIHYKDIVNVFGTKAKSQHSDVFRSNSSYITTVVFDKTFSTIKHGSTKNMNQKMYATSCAMIFLGNSDGIGALYDCFRRITLLQNLPFLSISRQCCKTVIQKKILSAAWLHYRNEGPVVYYSLDTHIVVWKVKKNEVKILHDNEQDCQNSRFNSGQLQIACLASLPSECCMSSDKNEHKLAIGYMGGKIVIIGFDPITSQQTTSLTIFAENGHNDDICSLSFSSYSLLSHQSYRQGLLCSVSRDSVLKVWSCSNQNEIAEHRILSNNYYGSNQKGSGGQTNTTNWFTAGFLPKSCIKNSNVSYEIILTNSSGDLLTFTLPEKGLNSKLRIGKTQRTFQSKMMMNNKNQSINHTFIIFSIAMDLEHKIAITNSLDYKLILWNLSTRTSETVFHSFSNGALAIDCCQTDKRIAIAFGSNVFVLDFIRESSILTNNDGGDDDNNININDDHHYDIHVQRLPLSSKTRFFNVIWNRKYFERLGRLIIGTLDGEIIHYDLNGKDIVFKSNKMNARDTSKIYSIIWLDTLLLEQEEDTNEKSSSSSLPVVLTLHQSGKIMVNYLSNNNAKMQENFDKYLVDVPENQKIKRTALLTSDDQKYLLMGNDDGTVDVFRRISEPSIIVRKAFQHLYRFRSFNRPCLSIEYCSRTNYLAITALHENYINCYRLDDIDNDNLSFDSSSNSGDNNNDESKLIVKTVPVKCRLQGHEDRVSFTCWCPFNRIDEINDKILLASASYDTTCIIWNVAKQCPLKRFFGHRSLIYSIKWCHFDSDFLFSGGEDNFFFWNWTIQPNFSSNFSIKHNVKLNSLRSLLENNNNNNGDDNETNDANVPSETAAIPIDSSISSLTSENSIIKNPITNKTSLPIKALFTLNNQIENNSSKYEHLEDIKWLIKLKTDSETVVIIPSNKLERILLYGQFEHIERLLQMEIENHKKNKNLEAQYILSLFLNARSFVEKLLKQNECDPILAMIASSYSRKLYENSIRTILGESSSSTESSNDCRIPQQQIQLNSKIKWTNYSKELCALIRICCLNEFNVSIDNLLAQNLFREAIILSVIHLASNTFVNQLMYRWHEYRLKQNNYEGAIKCLISSGHSIEALELLKQRRTLCTETSGNSILRQYDEIIELLKKNIDG